MREKRNVSKNIKKNSREAVKTNSAPKYKTSKKKNIKPLVIIDYVFFISLALSIIFGIQTNTAIFFWPFTIVLAITVVCMCIILVNAIYSKIKKKFNKK